MGIRKKEARSQETFPTSSPFLKFNLGEEGRRTGARRLALKEGAGSCPSPLGGQEAKERERISRSQPLVRLSGPGTAQSKLCDLRSAESGKFISQTRHSQEGPLGPGGAGAPPFPPFLSPGFGLKEEREETKEPGEVRNEGILIRDSFFGVRPSAFSLLGAWAYAQP